MFDRSADVVLGIAKLYFSRGVAGCLYFNQIGEPQRLVFVPILNQDIEIGVDQGRLIAIGNLKGGGVNAKLLIGLLLQFGVTCRVDKLYPDFTFAGNFVLADKVA